MPKKKDPNLKTKYENDDPDFQSRSSTSQPTTTRPQRSAKQTVQYREDSTEISDDETYEEPPEFFDQNDPQTAPSRRDVDINDILIDTNKLFTNNSNTSQMAEEKLIKTIVSAMLQAQAADTKSSHPKVDIPKLSMHNFVDWSKKCNTP